MEISIVWPDIKYKGGVTGWQFSSCDDEAITFKKPLLAKTVDRKPGNVLDIKVTSLAKPDST